MFSRLAPSTKWSPEFALRLLCYYGIPLIVAISTILALTAWDYRYVVERGNELNLHVLAQRTDSDLTLKQAVDSLDEVPKVKSYETHRSPYPVWFSFDVNDLTAGREYVEFPSRHAVEVSCWNSASLSLLGRASRSGSEGALELVKAGYSLKLARPYVPTICRGKFVGPAVLVARQWDARGLQTSMLSDERQSALLSGGIIVLALFVFTIAIVNKQPVYIIFAGWLVINLRIGALSAGWDIDWLGYAVPVEWLSRMRALTFAFYAVSTLMLFQALFKSDIPKTRYGRAFKLAEWLCFPLLAAAIWLPYQTFLPLMWGLTAYGLGLMILSLFSIVSTSRTRTAAWFILCLVLVFLAGLAEMIAAAFNAREVLGFINSLTAAIASSLLAALAVAEQMRAETARRIEAQQQLAHAYQAMPVGLFTLTASGKFIGANPLLAEMLSEPPIVTNQTRLSDYFSVEDCKRLFELVNSQISAELEVHNLAKTKQFLITATLAGGRIEGFLQDITEQAQANDQLQFLANNDPLTKTLNRRGIERAYERSIKGVSQEAPLCVAYLDLDRFKLINDLYGHNAGDEVLKEVCDRVSAEIAERSGASGCYFGRVGGDEFVLILPTVGLALASLICRGIVDRICSQAYMVGERAFHVRGSMGLVEIHTCVAMKDAVSIADRACVEAKKGMSDGLTIYRRNAAEMREHEAELDLVATLAKSAPADGLILEMRPVMSLKDPFGSVDFEAVLHLRTDDDVDMPVAPLIAAAEKSGKAGLIDRWVLARTLDWIRSNWHELSSTQFICVRLAAASLNDERLVQRTIEMLSENQHLTARLCLCISESAALYDITNTRRFLELVRNSGARVALDDFGAGLTSFSYLMELPADALIIDGKFIDNINGHPANAAIVEAVVSLARNLGMKTIAHSAGSADIVRTLNEIGVDYITDFKVNARLTTESVYRERSAATFVEDDDLADLLAAMRATAA